MPRILFVRLGIPAEQVAAAIALPAICGCPAAAANGMGLRPILPLQADGENLLDHAA